MVNERFLELLTKKLTDELNAEENAELESLLREDESCRQQHDFFQEYWKNRQTHDVNSKSLFEKVKSKIVAEENIAPISIAIESNKPTNKIYFTYWRSIAALLLLGSVTFGYYKLSYKEKENALTAENLQIKQAQIGAKSTIILTDGTKVTLNSSSSLKYPASFTGKTRDVYLNGEAFFDVHKDHQHPFVVHIGKMNVRVLGTAFDVKSYNNDSRTETTLIRGMIEVTFADRPSDRIILRPKEKLVVQRNAVNGTQSASKDSLADIKYSLTSLTYFKKHDTTVVETSWLNNKFIFKNEDFGTLSNQMERRYGVKIHFKDEHLRDYRFTGIFEKESITQVLDALRLIEPFKYKEENTGIYIY